MAIDPPGALSLDDNGLMIESAAQGMGIAFVPEYLASERLKTGELVITLDAWCPEIPGNVLYQPGYRYVPSALRAFIDLLKDVSRQMSPLSCHPSSLHRKREAFPGHSPLKGEIHYNLSS